MTGGVMAGPLEMALVELYSCAATGRRRVVLSHRLC